MENEEKRELTVNKKESVWVRGMSNDKILQNERKPTWIKVYSGKMQAQTKHWTAEM